MIIIETYTSTKFKLDGIPYLKNYISEVAGNQITIFNAYDRKDVRSNWLHYSEITLDGVVYGNVSDLQNALLPVIYTRASLGGATASFDLTVYEEGDTPISNVNEIEVIGATVTDEGGGKVTLEVVGGGMENVIEKVISCTLADIGASDFDDDVTTKLATYVNTLSLTKAKNELYRIELLEYEINFDVTATDWDSVSVVDEASFIDFLETTSFLTDVIVENFSLVSGRLQCNLTATGTSLYLTGISVTDAYKFGDIDGMYELYLDGNNLVTFNPTIALTSSLQYLNLSSNQMTTAGYTASEPWATNLHIAPVVGSLINLSYNIDSASGTTLETILTGKGWTVIT